MSGVRSTVSELRAARTAAGLSLPALAGAAGVSAHTLRCWEYRGRCPWRGTLEAVAAVLGVPAADLDPDCWAKRTRSRYGSDPAGLALQKLRHAAGLTAEQVAAAIGTTSVAIGHWESGRASPDPRYRATLAGLYGVDTLPLPRKVAARAAGTSLAAMRLRAGLSQTRAAAAIGVSASVLRAWEHGRTRPPDATLPVLGWLYGVDGALLLPALAPSKPASPCIDGQRLWAARLARGWTQDELARRIGVSGSAVARWETEHRGHHRCPPPGMAQTLANALQVRIEELVSEPVQGRDDGR